MFNNNNYEYNCTKKCRLKAHGNAITSALTKRSIKDDELAAYVAKTCCNFADNVDDLGRSAVHIAASVNRYEILEWLLNQGSIISGRDYESGSTPLHRAIFYGCIDCAILLLRYGASLELLDEDRRTPLQQVCRLCNCSTIGNELQRNEVLVWGLNKNYNLGVSSDQGIENVPQMLDYFRKEQISLEAVALGAYHSLFLDKRGHVYAVGHGKGGRLGVGNEDSITTPKKVKLKNSTDEVACISVSRKHSLLLTNNSAVYVCGLNDHGQLGLRENPEKLLHFKEVVTLKSWGIEDLINVIACDYYSLTYSLDCIYVWGKNLGQLGFDVNTKTVPLPKMMKLPPNTRIQHVEANSAAIVVLTVDNWILLFHNYKVKLLKPPNYESLKSIAIIDGNVTGAEKGSASALKLLILTQTNVVFLWYQLTQLFYRCSFTPRLTQIDKILYKSNQVLLLSQGDVYKGKCQQVSMPSYCKEETVKRGQVVANIWSRYDNRSTEMAKDFMIRIDLQIIHNIDRALDIFCDEDFVSFAALQESHIKYFKLPNLVPEQYTFKKLSNDINEYDNIHDVVFYVDGDKFPANKFIIYSRSMTLRNIVRASTDKNVSLNYPGLTSKMFEIMLKYIYTNYLPNEEVLLSDLKDIQNSINPEDRPQNVIEVLNWFISFVEIFQLNNFAKYLKSYCNDKRLDVDKCKYRFNRLRHTDFPELYDLRIICENNIELAVHKCVLVSRLEYFEMMFTHTWSEQTVVHLTTVPYEYMLTIVEFLYSLDINQFRKKKYRETFLYNMIVFCDQFFIERLREVCEILLLEKISIRRCGEMLDFACMYNCAVLKKGCLDFICQNMARVLLQKSLYNCEPSALKCINQHYREMFKHIFDYRVITPDSAAIDDACLLSFVEDFQVDLDYKMNENEDKASTKQKVKEAKGSANTTSVRHYEREAITSMMATLSVAEKQAKSLESESKDIEMIDHTSQEYMDSKEWSKVTDKKEQKKKFTLEHILKANDILKQESKPNGDFVTLRKTSESAGKCVEDVMDASSNATKAFNINLADLATPSREKLSQKQRKRARRTSSITESTPEPASSPPTYVNNAWGVVVSPIKNDNDYGKSPPPTGSLVDPSSFANMMRYHDKKLVNANSPPTASNSFSQILADEKRQREQYERMRHKSLALTQIEEQAIVELRDFYNVDRINDEIITIQRKPQPQCSINFTIWQRN